MSLSFSIGMMAWGLGIRNGEYQICKTWIQDVGVVEKKGAEGIASGRQSTVALVELTTSKNVLKTAK